MGLQRKGLVHDWSDNFLVNFINISWTNIKSDKIAMSVGLIHYPFFQQLNSYFKFYRI